MEQDEQQEMEEFHFSKLSDKVYDDVTKLKVVPDDNVRIALQNIIHSFRGSAYNFNSIDLSEWEYSCAYFCRYGSHGAGLTRCRVLEALHKCQDLVKKFEEPNLSVISLGGGPGNDIIGLCSALSKCNVQTPFTIKVIDSVEEWSLFLETYKFFAMTEDFGNVSKFFRSKDVSLTFLQATLPVDPDQNEEYFETLRNADIILMTKFLSSASNYVGDIIKSLNGNLKDGAIILFIDSPFEELWWRGFEILYVSDSGDKHRYSSPPTNTAIRLGFPNNISSKARVAVLRKR